MLEGRAHSVAATVAELADYLVGEDPLQIERHWQTLYRGGFYRGGGMHMSAIAGIDQALWDIKGKYHDTPVHQLLGGQVRNRIRVYDVIIDFFEFKFPDAERCSKSEQGLNVDSYLRGRARARESFVLYLLYLDSFVELSISKLNIKHPSPRAELGVCDHLCSCLKLAGAVTTDPWPNSVAAPADHIRC